jgi:hypothetical protein
MCSMAGHKWRNDRYSGMGQEAKSVLLVLAVIQGKKLTAVLGFEITKPRSGDCSGRQGVQYGHGGQVTGASQSFEYDCGG